MKKFTTWIKQKNMSKTNKILIVMRGLPGNGKSFTARQLLKKNSGGHAHDHIFSTDDYWNYDVKSERHKKTLSNDFVDHQYYDELEKDTYLSNWNPDRLSAAHTWNQRRVQQALTQGLTPIIVDNTNTTAREMKFYVEAGEKAGYKVIISESESPWWLDHKEMFNDKQKNGTKLEDFARFLAGHHQGMNQKYGTKGNTHGVPLDVIRNMIRRYQPNLTVDDVMGRTDRFNKK